MAAHAHQMERAVVGQGLGESSKWKSCKATIVVHGAARLLNKDGVARHYQPPVSTPKAPFWLW